MFNSRRSESQGNRAPHPLDFLRRPRMDRSFGCEVTKVEVISLKQRSSFMGSLNCCEIGYIMIEIDRYFLN